MAKDFENNRSLIPAMGEKTVISVVLQILKTISDGDPLDSQRCLILDGSLIFFTTIPPNTGYHFVRIFIPLHTIILYHYYKK